MSDTGFTGLEETEYIPKENSADRLSGVSAPVLEDTDYVAPQKKSNLDGIAAPQLADDDYVAPQKKSNLDGIAAPQLADDDYVAPPKKSNLDGIAAPKLEETASAASAAAQPAELTEAQIAVLQANRAAAGQPPYTEAQLDQLREAYRKQQAAKNPAPAAPKAPVLEDTTYTAPQKKSNLDGIAAPKLEETPPEPERKTSRFSEAEIAEAKASAQKRAIESSLAMTTNVNKEESRMYMNALRAEREAEMAKKGFVVVLVLMMLGFVAALCLYLFSRQFDVESEALKGFYAVLANGALYVSVAEVVTSILMLLRLGPAKSLTSFLFGLTALLLLFPGIPMLMQVEKAKLVTTAVFWGISLVLSIAVCFTLSTNEAVEKFYQRKEND